MNQKLRNLVYTAMLMALCCVATLVIKIPTVTGGYLNAGDIVVVLAALLAGPLYGGVAAGFGSGLADVISGYMSYAPGTLVVKGCAAVVAALIFRACRKKSFDQTVSHRLFVNVHRRNTSVVLVIVLRLTDITYHRNV